MAKVTAPTDVIDDAQGASSVVASSIRVLRRRSGLTLATLAEKTELDKGYLSRIERGQKSPSIGTLLKIAEALDVQVGHLFGETTADSITVVRHDENIDVSDIPGAPLTQAILPASGGRRISAFLIEPGTEKESRHTEHPGDELLYVLQGSVEVSFPDRVVQLEAGDCIHFDGHLRHHVRRVGKKISRVLLIVAQDPASPAN